MICMFCKSNILNLFGVNFQAICIENVRQFPFEKINSAFYLRKVRYGIANDFLIFGKSDTVL